VNGKQALDFKYGVKIIDTDICILYFYYTMFSLQILVVRSFEILLFADLHIVSNIIKFVPRETGHDGLQISKVIVPVSDM